MQHLWNLGLQRDDPLPKELNITSQSFSLVLVLFLNIKLPRHILMSSRVQILGFSDASEKIYAAVVSPKSLILIMIFQLILLHPNPKLLL